MNQDEAVMAIVDALYRFESDTEDGYDERTLGYAKRMILIRDARLAIRALAEPWAAELAARKEVR